MKILHTSDWHLGHRFHEQSQYEEQNAYLDWLSQYIVQNNIDILLVAGDIFDTGVPSTQSQKLYYDFLINLQKTNCKYVVIIGGNHDSPGTINAPKSLLNALSIYVVGKATNDIKEEVFEFKVNGQKIIIAAVPYLRDQDIRRATAGESFDEIGDRYKIALTNHYNQIAEHCKKIKSGHTPVIAMGHLFAIGGSVSDSEQTIYVGNLGDIKAKDFPKIFDYIALGHLHRSQKINNFEHIRYSGSPYILSFSEINYKKNVIFLKIENDNLKRIEDIHIPTFRDIHRVEGSLEKCIEELKIIDKKYHQNTPWVEVVLDNQHNTSIGFTEITKVAEKLDLEVLKVSLKNKQKSIGLEKLMENSKHIKELSPIEVFKMKCKEQDFDLDKNPEIFDAFNEVLQIALND